MWLLGYSPNIFVPFIKHTHNGSIKLNWMTWVPAGNKYAEVVLTSIDITLTHIPHLFTDVIMDRLIWETGMFM